jgi:hypothetical protein
MQGQRLATRRGSHLAAVAVADRVPVLGFRLPQSLPPA